MAHAAAEHSHAHEAHESQESLKVLGFWIFIVTDILIFGTLFACYAVLHTHTNGGPGAKELFEMPGVIAETFILLTSSFTSGLAILAMQKGKVKQLIAWLAVTAVLGAVFIGMEVHEFLLLIEEGHTISSNAFLSAFYTLVGTHGLHVSIGLVWMIAIMIQLSRRGITEVTTRKVTNLSLYWHFLDVIWIFVFTVVYLMGVM